jgi:hypothetical protein
MAKPFDLDAFFARWFGDTLDERIVTLALCVLCEVIPVLAMLAYAARHGG